MTASILASIRWISNCRRSSLVYLSTAKGLVEIRRRHLGRTIRFSFVPTTDSVVKSKIHVLLSPGDSSKDSHFTAVIVISFVAQTPSIGSDPLRCVCEHNSPRWSFGFICQRERDRRPISTWQFASIINIMQSPEARHICSCQTKSDSNRSRGETS